MIPYLILPVSIVLIWLIRYATSFWSWVIYTSLLLLFYAYSEVDAALAILLTLAPNIIRLFSSRGS
jgi:hypothetical protein